MIAKRESQCLRGHFSLTSLANQPTIVKFAVVLTRLLSEIQAVKSCHKFHSCKPPRETPSSALIDST